MIEANSKSKLHATTQEQFDYVVELGWRIMSWEKVSTSDLWLFILTLKRLPRSAIHDAWDSFRATALEAKKVQKDQEYWKSFRQWSVDNVTNEWQLCSICIMEVKKYDTFRGDDEIIVLSKEFLRRDPGDKTKQAFGYYGVWNVSSIDHPEHYNSIKKDNTILFRNYFND